MADNENNQNDSSQGMHIDVGHLSVTGHVVFAGRDGTVSVSTGGDVAQTNTTTMTVGGVETTRQEYDSMVNSLRNVQTTIETAPLQPENREVAEHNFQTVEQQLTSERKPNAQILAQAIRTLVRLSPIIGGAVASLFAEPLVGQIVTAVGGTLQGVYDSLMNAMNKNT